MHPLLQAFGMTKKHDFVLNIPLISIMPQISWPSAITASNTQCNGYARFIQGLGRNSSESRDRQYYCLKIATGIWPILGDKAVPWGQWMRLHESCLKAFEAEPRSYLVRHYVQTAIQLSTMYLFNKSDQQSAVELNRLSLKTLLHSE